MDNIITKEEYVWHCDDIYYNYDHYLESPCVMYHIDKIRKKCIEKIIELNNPIQSGITIIDLSIYPLERTELYSLEGLTMCMSELFSYLKSESITDLVNKEAYCKVFFLKNKLLTYPVLKAEIIFMTPLKEKTNNDIYCNISNLHDRNFGLNISSYTYQIHNRIELEDYLNTHTELESKIFRDLGSLKHLGIDKNELIDLNKIYTLPIFKVKMADIIDHGNRYVLEVIRNLFTYNSL